MKNMIAAALLASTFAGVLMLQIDIALSGDPSARDPGVRNGRPDAGSILPGASRSQQQYFDVGREDFMEVETVDEGMGPRMNLDSCGGCHSQPAIGGTSPAINPQKLFASGGADQVPPFIASDGPIREARFIRNADGTPSSPSRVVPVPAAATSLNRTSRRHLPAPT